MAWKQTHLAKNLKDISGLSRKKNTWVLRGFEAIYGYDSINHQLQWKLDFLGDHSFGYKSVVTSKNIAVTSAHCNKDPNDIWTFAIEIQTGNIIWKRKVNWGLRNNLGGILAKDDLVIFMEESDKLQLFFIEITSGEIALVIPGVRSKPTGLSQRGPNSSTIGNNYAYFCCPEDGLYRAKIDITDSQLTKVIEGNAEITISSTNHVYCLLSQELEIIVCLDSKTGKEINRIYLSEDFEVENITICYDLQNSNDYLALLLGEGEGIALLEPISGNLLWVMGKDEKWYVTDIVSTPYGIVLLANIDYELKLFCLELASGKLMIPPQVTEGFVEDELYWTGNQLLLNTSRGIQIFSWE